MKFLYLFLVFVAILQYACAAVSFGLPGKKTHCQSDGTCVDYCDYAAKDLLPGESSYDNCMLIRCNSDFSMNFETCGVASRNDCWRLGPDLSLPYPDCCNQICLEPLQLKIYS